MPTFRSFVARLTLAACGFCAIVASLSGVAGCTAILGIQDFTVLDDGGDSSVGDNSEGGTQTDATAYDANDGTAMSDALDATAADHADARDADAGSTGDGSADGSRDGTAVPDAPGPSEAGEAGQGGDGSTCLAGGSCSPGECQVGQYTCDDGGLTCGSVQPVTNGTQCGGDGGAGDSGATGSVCKQGVCSACNSGADCSVANSCKTSVYVCTTGSAVCTQVGNANDGTMCGSGMVCSGGVCTTCMVGNPCTPTNACHKGSISACTGGVATCTDTMTAANNGMICGMNQVCNGGVCSSCAANVACQPANACHTGVTSCATGVSTCVDTNTNQTNGSSCTGTDKCSQTYTCQGGMCTGSNPVTCTASDSCHTAGTCDSTTGVCSNPVAGNGITCPTGADKCNQTYTCQSGMCTGSNPVTCTASDQCHSAGTCDTTTGACSNPAVMNGNACTGTNKCFGSYTCQGGTCTGASPVTCPAPGTCHVLGTCDPTSGACSNPNAMDGTGCATGGMTCQGGVCQCPAGTTNCSGTCVNEQTDASNCGACGQKCLGGMCSSGMCQPILMVSDTIGSISDIATDGTVVVYIESAMGEILEVDSPGGTSIPLATSGSGVTATPERIGMDPGSGAVFWTQGDGTLAKAQKGTMNSGTGISNCSTSSPFALYVNPGGTNVDLLTGGQLFTCLSTLPGEVADTTMGVIGPAGATLSPRWAYGDMGGGGRVIFGSAGGATGNPAAIIPGQAGVNYTWDDGTYAYWATSDPAIRRSAFATPSTVTTVVSNTGGTVGGLTTDGKYVYYATPSGLFFAPVAGGTAKPLASAVGAFLKYASGAVFYQSAGSAIYKVATPP